MRHRASFLPSLLLAALAVALGFDPAHARSLSSKLNEFVSNVTNPLAGVQIAEPLTPIIKRAAIRGADFPVASTTPGFVYRYDPEVGMFERSDSLGPVFLERSDTIGKGRVDLGFSYLYTDLTEFDGEDFADDMLLASQVNNVSTTSGPVNVAGAFQGTDFSLRYHSFTFSGTYGVTDRWDVNVIVPLLYTILDLEGDAVAAAQFLDTGGIIGNTEPARVSFSDFVDSNDAFGVGDVQGRTKYRLMEGGIVDMAATFAVRFPTGEEDNFQGLGDFTLTPSLVASKNFGPHNVHMQLGVEFNTDDMDRTRGRYGIGGALQIIESVAFLVELIGSSSFTDDEFDIATVKAGEITPDQLLLPSQFVKRQTATEIVAFVPQSNIIDIATGFKFNIAGRVVAYVSAIIPITNDGLRTSTAVPTGGLQYSF